MGIYIKGGAFKATAEKTTTLRKAALGSYVRLAFGITDSQFNEIENVVYVGPPETDCDNSISGNIWVHGLKFNQWFKLPGSRRIDRTEPIISDHYRLSVIPFLDDCPEKYIEGREVPGPWLSSKSYKVGDLVMRDNIYECVLDAVPNGTKPEHSLTCWRVYPFIPF